ncbi:DnaJ domain-containing protein [Sphingomonas sp.]|jgi:hypothetical protein|uniref:DnaJ domain-containing protein n=1 Tax=Sphingomonas sp. TaxID=28214 RepID=UPI002E32D330|nr:DnaJ domain-containing protein [Sphingomonas sp.]HEX4695708.1 DnaJ domain-containing protein [Sphingomonas sp.]
MAVASDPYIVLGIAPDVDDAAVRAARRALLRRYHPDTAGDLPDAAERTHAINAAYAEIIAERRAEQTRFLTEDIPPVDIAPAHAWVESPYPMPPRRSAAPTLAMILVFVGLPAMAMTLPGVPGHVAEAFPAEGAKATAFARSRLAQVRRLLTPAGFGAPAPVLAARRAAPPPVSYPAVVAATVARAVGQYRRVAARGGEDVAAYARDCADRARRYPGWAAQDFCVAFDLAADRLDEAATREAYARLGAPPAAAMARVEQVKALIE